ncbi:hypothetical protein P4S72_22500 [Vibrio sp. PP-XX7]
MIAAMQGLKDLFEGAFPLKKLVRGLGMSAFNQMPSIKNDMMLRALGLRGHLPELAQNKSQ